ncbi:MAG: hypothetical protein QNJ65_09655 [Xenococcaceae cyanobacterium MO_234.B1]|nr:hypothetical protein [Xenococcaceae cyanobacterium MO_234.B1]
MAEITVAFDAGTSRSKVIASYPSGECVFNDENYFLIKPSVRQLTEQTYCDSLEYVEGGIGLSSSLVSYINPASGESVYWEVGEGASRLGLLSVQERKFETALVKVLAFLGYLVSNSVGLTEQVGLTLGILLPLDELEDRALLGKWLRAIITQGFSVNGYLINNITVDKIHCKPEGYGIFKSYPQDKAGVLIMGHSDLSWLYFDQGLFSSKLSRTFPGEGMHSFLGCIKFPIQDELSTAELIAKAGANLNPKVLVKLTQTKSQDEIAYLTKAIKSALPQYWSERKKELKSLDIKNADIVSVAGGAAHYFAIELNQLFKALYGIRLNWCKPMISEFRKRFALKASDKSSPLFLDCFGYYKSLVGLKVVPNSKIVEAQKEVLKNASS